MKYSRQTLLESLADRAKCLTLSGGRLLLDLERSREPHLANPVKAQQRAEMLVSRGVAFARLGLWKEAIRKWREAIELNPHNSDARNNLAVAYELAGEVGLAAAEYERALALHAKNVYIEQNYQLHREAMTSKGKKEEHRETLEMTRRF